MEDTLILTRSEIVSLVTPSDVLEALRRGFIAIANTHEPTGQRFPVELPPPAPESASAMLLAPGYVPGIPAYTVKVHAKFPSANPALSGVILLHSIEDGRLLAIFESTFLTALRTGCSGALGADALARPGAARVAIIGAGAQGVSQLECLAAVRQIDHVTVFDSVMKRAASFAEREGTRLGLSIAVKTSVGEAVADADIVVTATWAREPFLFSSMIQPGTHITTLGPDQPGKAEVDADLIRRSIFVADDRSLALSMGAIGGVGLGLEAIHADLGEVLTGQKTGRTSTEDITVFGAVGLPFQDLAAAWPVYVAARDRKVGRKVRFLG